MFTPENDWLKMRKVVIIVVVVGYSFIYFFLVASFWMQQMMLHYLNINSDWSVSASNIYMVIKKIIV